MLMYTILSRKTLSKSLIPQLYESTQASVRERVQISTAVCLTTDCWTSRVTTSYMSVTCHFIEGFSMSSCLLDCFEFSDRHTSENLAEELLSVAKEWQVDGKVVYSVSDNAANITNQPDCKKFSEGDEAYCGQSESSCGMLPQEHIRC